MSVGTAQRPRELEDQDRRLKELVADLRLHKEKLHPFFSMTAFNITKSEQ